jgi:hypothetical protein
MARIMRNVHVSPWLAVLLALSASPPASSQQRLEADLYAAHIAMTLVPRVQSYRRDMAVPALNVHRVTLEEVLDRSVDAAYVLWLLQAGPAALPLEPVALDPGLMIYCRGRAPTRDLVSALLDGAPSGDGMEMGRYWTPLPVGELRWAETRLRRVGFELLLDIELHALRPPLLRPAGFSLALVLGPEPLGERVRFGDAQPVPLLPVRVRQAGTVPHGG